MSYTYDDIVNMYMGARQNLTPGFPGHESTVPLSRMNWVQGQMKIASTTDDSFSHEGASRMQKHAYSTMHPVDLAGGYYSDRMPSPFPEDAHGTPMTMLRAYYENAYHQMAVAEHRLGTTRNLMQDALGRMLTHPERMTTDMTSPYHAFLAMKHANEGFDPILQHPALAAKPRGMDEMAQRKKELQIGASLGGGIGVAAGLGGVALAKRVLPGGHAIHTPGLGPLPELYGGLLGLGLGTGAGMGIAHLPRFIDKLKRHDTASRDYESRTGETLPMDVRHPYVARFVPSLAASVAGSLIGGRMTRGQNVGPMAGHVAGSLVGSMVGGVLTPGTLALLQDRRDQLLKGRVHQGVLRGSVLDEDALNEQALGAGR